jgi:release factor glutamine methyltransferase
LKLLKSGGRGIVEINEALGEETAELYRNAGFSHVHIIKDLNDKDRFVAFMR